MQDCLRCVVAGDVDSGKSTLIGRFLYDSGSLPQGIIEELEISGKACGRSLEFAHLLDSLEEERQGELTIDTTQVFCRTKKGKEFIFIDVPGHQELLKNMLSGSSYAEVAILVIDVEKSVTEQTRRHLFILRFLGIEQIIVVFNKMDAAGFSADKFESVERIAIEAASKAGINFQDCIPLSARNGINLSRRSRQMAWYHGPALIEALNIGIKKRKDGNFRFAVQDIYNFNHEQIAVGKIISGKLKKGEQVNILPIGELRRVKAIKVFPKDLSFAQAPQSIGLVLDEMSDMARGLVICKPRLPKVAREIMAKIFCIRNLNLKEKIIFECLTQESSAKIIAIKSIWDSASLSVKENKDLLEGTDVAEVTILFDKDMVVEDCQGNNSSLGRFVLKDKQGICVVGAIITS